LQYFAVPQHLSRICSQLNKARFPTPGSGPIRPRPSRERGAIIKPGVQTPGTGGAASSRRHPPRIPENPFVQQLWTSRFDVRCCISRSHLVKSEFSIDFHHNIVFYKRLRAEPAHGHFGFARHVSGATSMVALSRTFNYCRRHSRHANSARSSGQTSGLICAPSGRSGSTGARDRRDVGDRFRRGEIACEQTLAESASLCDETTQWNVHTRTERDFMRI
jgi:hypothetical protein